MSKKVVLVSPEGREYTAGSPSEVTRLKARGYKVKPAPVARPAEPVVKSKK